MTGRITAAALVLLAIGAYAATLLGMTSEHPAAAAAEPTVAAAPAAVAPELPALDATDAAYLADLLGPDTDVPAEQAFAMTEQGRRIAALLSHPENVPAGAETPTREAIVETLTTPGALPGGGSYTPEEAGKIIDCALGAYATA